jgi:flagellar hook-associated protein 2
LQARAETFETQLSAYGQVKSALSTFQSAMRSLNHVSDFKKFSATSSNESVLTASTNSATATGEYSIEVDRMAQAHSMASSAQNNATVFGGAVGDELSVSIDGQSLSVDMSGGKTLAELAEAINSHEDNMGVRATVINVDSSGTSQRLALVSPASGYDNRIELSGAGGIDPSADFGFATTNRSNGVLMNDLTELDAALTVDGISVTRSDNTVDDMIPGVTLNLNSASPGSVINLEVTRDTETISEAVQAFGEAYNTLTDTLEELRLGDLEADSTIRMLESQIRGVLNQGGGSGTYSHLSQVGLSLDKYGDMQFDESDLRQALDTDIESVAELFAGDGTGIASGFDDLVNDSLGYKGLIQTRVEGIERRQESNLDDQYDMELRLEATEQRYYSQYAALDSLVAQMTNTSSYLTQQLDAMNSSSK